ncbi:MAG TPA: hypothetical protein VGC13_04860 [Longimicrobium sp.]|jgi:hypothetical protein|uniref:hypothetical protein n=1 Tax=Longimicrobium sp. TaxID=2029185 RepID=UPI002EDB3AE6
MKIPSDWLTVRVENRPIPEHRDLPPMPALRIRREWEKLKAQAVEGDEVWAFANPSNTWKRLGKHSGYAIVRKGKIIQSVVVTSA